MTVLCGRCVLYVRHVYPCVIMDLKSVNIHLLFIYKIMLYIIKLSTNNLSVKNCLTKVIRNYKASQNTND